MFYQHITLVLLMVFAMHGRCNAIGLSHEYIV